MSLMSQIHSIVSHIKHVFESVTGFTWEVTSVDRPDLTAHSSGRAVDIAIRGHPAHQRLLDGGCPYYYDNPEIMRMVHRIAPRLARIRHVHLVLVERDHVHVELSRYPIRRRCEVAIYRKKSSGYCPEPQSQIVSIWRSNTNMYNDEEGGLLGDEDGGLEEYGEEGGLLLDEEGGPEDDPNWLVEHGGFDDEEMGGKKKRRSLFGRRKKKKRGGGRPACPPPGSHAGGALGTPSLLELRSMSLKNGVPFISVSSGIKVNVSPVPLEYRVPRALALYGMMTNAARTGQPPVITSIAPAHGAYALNLLPPVGTMIETPIVILDVGPQALTTQAGATLTTRITGRYVDGSLADMGEFSLQLPNVISVMRIVYLPYAIYNGIPVFKMLACSNTYLAPHVPAIVGPFTQDPDSGGDIEAPVAGPLGTVTQAITISGVVPAGLQLTGTIVTPTHPLWASIASSLNKCGCR